MKQPTMSPPTTKKMTNDADVSKTKMSKPQVAIVNVNVSPPLDPLHGGDGDASEQRGTPKEAAGTSTGTRSHGIATKALKVFLATAAVAGTIWGVTKGSAAARNNAAALLVNGGPKSKATKSPVIKSKAPKGGKQGKAQVPSIMATSNGDCAMNLEWPPACPETDEECEQIFCNGVQTFLQKTLCTKKGQGCNVVVPCYEVTQARRKLELDDPKTKLLHRALEATNFPFSVSLIIECVNGDCSDPEANLAAAVAAMEPIETGFGQITDEEMTAGIIAAILAQVPPPAPDTADYFTQFNFVYDPSSSSINDPTVIEVPSAVPGFEFVGPGYCSDSKGYEYGYIAPAPSSDDVTIEQCATLCLQIAGSTCWTQNAATYPLRGIDYEPGPNAYCYCLFEVTSGKPTDICPVDKVDREGKGSGVGPVFTFNQNSYQCYKYIG